MIHIFGDDGQAVGFDHGEQDARALIACQMGIVGPTGALLRCDSQVVPAVVLTLDFIQGLASEDQDVVAVALHSFEGGLGAGRDGRAGHDAHRRARLYRLVEDVAGGQVSHHTQPARLSGRAPPVSSQHTA